MDQAVKKIFGNKYKKKAVFFEKKNKKKDFFSFARFQRR